MVFIPAPQDKRLVWYLAMEEYFGQHITEYAQGVFFTWVVPPTVIFGRHQVMEQEVNIDYCKSHGVNMFRRKSGGGCVYADKGNLMLSYIVPSVHAEQVFNDYLAQVSSALRKLGFAAVCSEHNDVLVDAHKVSGNACYALNKGTIVHGTMLYDVDFGAMQQAITPSRSKLEKHGVESVRQRVINLKQMMTAEQAEQIQTVESLSDFFVGCFTDSEVHLTAADLKAIDEIEATYLDEKFLYRM